MRSIRMKKSKVKRNYHFMRKMIVFLPLKVPNSKRTNCVKSRCIVLPQNDGYKFVDGRFEHGLN